MAKASDDRAARFLQHLEPLKAALEAYSRRCVHDPNSVEDILQEAVGKAFRDFHLYAEGTNFRAWIFRYLNLEITRATARSIASGARHCKPASGLNLDVVADQSVFVRNTIRNLTWEGVLGAVLASLMMLIFIGSFRSTIIIALTIPLSALAAIVGLYFTGNTLNAMILGLALVMGRLVDDPIVDTENTFQQLDMGKSPKQAALDSAMEIAMPVLVAPCQ